MISQSNELFVYDEERWAKTVEKTYLIDEPALVREYDDAIVLPLRYRPETVKQYGDGLLEGGLCSYDFKFLAGLKRSYGKRDVNRNCSFSYEVEAADIERRDESVIFGGLLMSHFGHMLCDGTTRLWYVGDHPEDTRKVVFVVYPGQAFPYWDLLEMAGIEPSRVELITRPTQFAHVSVPDETSFSLGLAGYKKEWTHVLARIRESVQPSPHKKVYYSRLKLKDSGCVGEEYFVKFFEKNGYHVVSPERLTFREQVALMVGADEFAATMGTIANQIMFARPGTHLTVINRSESVVEGVALSVEAAGAHASYVDAFKNVMPEKQGGFCVHLLATNRHWDAFLAAHPELNARAAGDYPLADNLLTYLTDWAARYDTPEYFRWVRDESTARIVKRMNRYLRDEEIDITDYLRPNWVEEYETDKEKMRQEVVRANAHMPNTALAHVRFDGRDLVVEAELSSWLVNHPDCAMRMVAKTSEGQELEPLGLLQLMGSNAGQLVAAQRFAMPTGVTEGVFVQGTVNLTAGDQTLKLLLVSGELGTGETCGVALLDDKLTLRAQPLFGSAVLAEVVKTLDLVPDELDYEIRKFSWEGATLRLEGVMVDAAVRADCSACSLVLTDVDENLVAEPSLEWLADGAAWTARIDLASVYQAMVSAGLENLEWHWRITAGNASRLFSFGRRRAVGSIGAYRANSHVADGLVVFPVEFEGKNLGFQLSSFESAPIVARIASATWKDDVLHLSGTLEGGLACNDQIVCSLAYSAGDELHVIPTQSSFTRPDTSRTWSAKIDPESIVKTAGRGSWPLEFVVQMGRAVNHAPFGAKRPTGTYANIGYHAVSIGVYEFDFTKDVDDNIVARVRARNAARTLARKLRR